MKNESRRSEAPTNGLVRGSRTGPAFPRSVSARVERLRRQHPALDDLATTFPALLVGLATGYSTPEARQAARAGVIAGVPLKEAARTLGLPFWLRVLPPAAFNGALPVMENMPALEHLVTYALPRDPGAMLPWIETVMLASRLAGPELAVWIGRHRPLLPPESQSLTTDWILAWAFFSRRPETPAGRIIRRPWQADIGPRVTIEETSNWRRRIISVVKLASHDPPWFRAGAALGYEIEPLDKPEALFSESVRMRNCLDIHLAQMSQESGRLYAIRRRGRSVATLELAPRTDEPGIPVIVQLKGLRNQRVATEVWQAVHAWMGSQPFVLPHKVGRRQDQQRAERRVWSELWAPLRERCLAIGSSRFEWTSEDWITSRHGDVFLGRMFRQSVA